MMIQWWSNLIDTFVLVNKLLPAFEEPQRTSSSVHSEEAMISVTAGVTDLELFHLWKTHLIFTVILCSGSITYFTDEAEAQRISDSPEVTQGHRFSESKPCAIFTTSHCFSLLKYPQLAKSSFFHEEGAHCIAGDFGSFLSDSRKRLQTAHEETLPRRCLVVPPCGAAYLTQHTVLQLCAQLQGCALAHGGQPVADHGLPGLRAGEVNQNPLLQTA